MHSFIHPLIHSFIHLLIHSFIFLNASLFGSSLIIKQLIWHIHPFLLLLLLLLLPLLYVLIILFLFLEGRIVLCHRLSQTVTSSILRIFRIPEKAYDFVNIFRGSRFEKIKLYFRIQHGALIFYLYGQVLGLAGQVSGQVLKLK